VSAVRIDVTTWYLEMTGQDQLRPAAPPRVGVSVERAEIPSPEFSRFLYSSVGGDHYWLERLSWTLADWRRWLDRPEVETWVARVRGTPAGYVELEAQPDGEVEIAYFGLLPAFQGQGLGGHLLTVGIRRAWELGGRRVWVHTCSLDGPHALANYQARGLRVYDLEVESEVLPDLPPGPWPGAHLPSA
jgi:ribosomal protein S18 acetylase RimI-like enzyme